MKTLIDVELDLLNIGWACGVAKAARGRRRDLYLREVEDAIEKLRCQVNATNELDKANARVAERQSVGDLQIRELGR